MYKAKENSEYLDIVLIHTSDQGGGAERCVMDLHQTFRNRGHRSRLFVRTKKSDDPDVHVIERFRCLPGVLKSVQVLEKKFGWQYLYHPWFRQLHKIIGHADVINFHSLWSNNEGFADMVGLNILSKKYPSLITLHDWWMLTGHCACPPLDCNRWKTGCGNCPDLNINPKINADGTAFNWSRKQKYIAQSPLSVISVSDSLKEYVSQSKIFHGKNIHTIHNGFDTEIFKPSSRLDARKELGLPQNDFIIMIAGQTLEGTPHNTKGAPAYALDALKSANIPCTVLAVGRSSEQFIKNWQGAGVAIPFVSSAEKLAKYYAAANLVLVTSLWETFGRISGEAQLCGIPVVSFATGGIKEIIQHEHTGILVTPEDYLSLGNAIREMYHSPDKRLAYGENGAKRSYQLFNQTTIAKKYLEVFRQEIDSRKN